jgi:protein ImuB
MRDTRIACLKVPCFPLAARLRVEPELAGQAVVVCEGDGTAARVAAVSRAAWRFGLRPGSTLAQARSRMGDVVARGRDAVAERSAHEALLEAAAALSPRVEDAGEDIAYADVSGMERLFAGDGGEVEIGRTAMLVAEDMSLLVQVGIAGTKLAARVAAARTPSPTVIATGEERSFLAPLPITSLGLPRRLRATLARWGIATVGDLARLPADRVAARLGADGRAAHGAACGCDPEPMTPHHPAPVLSEGLELEWAVVTVEPLLAALRPCLERIHRRLEQQDLACTLLELELGLEPDGIDRRLIRLPAPARDVEALLVLVRLEVEARPPQGPVAAFRCFVHPDRPRTGQLTLFGPPEIHPDRLAVTLARLAARLGPDRVGSPRPVDSHLPERTASVPFEPPPPPRHRLPPRCGRGLLAVRVLRPPVALEVIVEERQPAPETAADDADGRPVSVASQDGAGPRIQGLVRVAAGPWHLEAGWWQDEPTARDYWDVELSGGGLYRIYRDRASNEWFADGIYD